MQTILKEKLKAFLMINNPDLIIKMDTFFMVNWFLDDKISRVMPLVQQLTEEGKPQYIIEELALNEMTASLKPSRYNYLQELLEEEFSDHFLTFQKSGVLRYELLNLIEYCTETFEVFGFCEANEEDRMLRYTIMGKVHEYLS